MRLKKRPSYTCLLIIHAAGSAWTCSYGHLLTRLYEGRHSGHFSKGYFYLCSGYGLFGCVCLCYWLYCYQFHVKCFICSISYNIDSSFCMRFFLVLAVLDFTTLKMLSEIVLVVFQCCYLCGKSLFWLTPFFIY